MLNEFRNFLLRGNVVDLAVAVVVGTAFGAIVTSLVTDILTPLLGLLGIPDFGHLERGIGPSTIRYGVFLNALISFVTVSAAVFFFVVKPINKLMERRKTQPDVENPTKQCNECLSNIPVGARRCAFCTSQVAA
ncbi:MAG TPA: large conductance mechanosensitive channel protein MscL [Actinomycetota bacterium]|nr:large conductance mechanosensitive channel protein MscL [Actinomycetota bacterium]